MGNTVGELLHNLAIKSGIDIHSNEWKQVLYNKELSEITLDDALYNTIDTKLIPHDMADRATKSHYQATLLRPIDDYLEDAIEDPELQKILSNEKSTYKKVEKIISHLKTKASEPIQAQEPKPSVDNAKVDELLKALEEAKQDKERALEAERKQREADRVQWLLDSKLNAFKTKLDTLDSTVKSTAIRELINTKLQSMNGKIGLGADGNSLELYDNEGNTYVNANHTKASLDVFLNETLEPVIEKIPAQASSAPKVIDPSATVNDIRSNRIASFNQRQMQALQDKNNL